MWLFKKKKNHDHQEKNNRSTYERIMEDGIEIEGMITDCSEKWDPRDDEHTIFSIDFEYEIKGQTFQGRTTFSINTAHIEYAARGELYGADKLKYTMQEFKDAMKRGNKMRIKVLQEHPSEYLLGYNDIMNDVMNTQGVWR